MSPSAPLQFRCRHQNWDGLALFSTELSTTLENGDLLISRLIANGRREDWGEFFNENSFQGGESPREAVCGKRRKLRVGRRSSLTHVVARFRSKILESQLDLISGAAMVRCSVEFQGQRKSAKSALINFYIFAVFCFYCKQWLWSWLITAHTFSRKGFLIGWINVRVF